MTEDETFRALSRPSVTEMKQIYRQWMRDQHPYSWNTDERRALFNRNGWGMQEFIEASRTQNIKLPHD